MSTHRSAAPLPFMGQKRHFIKELLQKLKELESEGIIHNKTIFVDVFGGSGLIAHHIKCTFPNHHVIWNDFDNYQQRLDNIEATNALCAKICEIAKKKTGYRIHEDAKGEILKLLQQQRSGILEFLKSFYGFENIEVFTRTQRINHHATYQDYLILQNPPPPPHRICA